MSTVQVNSPAQRYNRIKHIDEQCLDWHLLIPDEVLQQIGEIFHASQSHKDFGLALLHRHGQIPPECVMVHSQDGLQRDICDIEVAGMRQIFPSAYLLDDSQFFPFEFSSVENPTPNSALLQKLAELLRAHHLEKILGVSRIPSDDTLWLEEVALDGKRLVAEMAPREPDDFNARFVQTEWAIRRREDKYVLRALKGCQKPEVGGHKVT